MKLDRASSICADILGAGLVTAIAAVFLLGGLFIMAYAPQPGALLGLIGLIVGGLMAVMAADLWRMVGH